MGAKAVLASRTLALSLAAGLCVAPTLGSAQETAAPMPSRSTESFADWNVDCTLAASRTPPGEDGRQDAPRRICEAVQVYSSGNTGAEIARLAFGYNGEDQALVMAMRMVADISFDQAPALVSGDETLIEGRVTRCTAGFCFAQFDSAEDVSQLLLATENPAVRYAVSSGQMLAITVSTDGLTAALDTLVARSQ